MTKRGESPQGTQLPTLTPQAGGGAAVFDESPEYGESEPSAACQNCGYPIADVRQMPKCSLCQHVNFLEHDPW